jgi:hypothetical protein
LPRIPKLPVLPKKRKKKIRLASSIREDKDLSGYRIGGGIVVRVKVADGGEKGALFERLESQRISA